MHSNCVYGYRHVSSAGTVGIHQCPSKQYALLSLLLVLCVTVLSAPITLFTHACSHDGLQWPAPLVCATLQASAPASMLSRLACSSALLGRALSQLVSSSGASAATQQAAACTRVSQNLWRSGFATNSTDIFNVHKDTPENNWDVQFDFTEENHKRVRDLSHPTVPLLYGKECRQSFSVGVAPVWHLDVCQPVVVGVNLKEAWCLVWCS